MVFEMGCWISVPITWALHRCGEELITVGESQAWGKSAVGKKETTQKLYSSRSSMTSHISNHVPRVRKYFAIPQVLTHGLIFVVISSEPSTIAK